jgi:tape measure domain-containing protein
MDRTASLTIEYKTSGAQAALSTMQKITAAAARQERLVSDLALKEARRNQIAANTLNARLLAEKKAEKISEDITSKRLESLRRTTDAEAIAQAKVRTELQKTEIQRAKTLAESQKAESNILNARLLAEKKAEKISEDITSKRLESLRRTADAEAVAQAKVRTEHQKTEIQRAKSLAEHQKAEALKIRAANEALKRQHMVAAEERRILKEADRVKRQAYLEEQRALKQSQKGNKNLLDQLKKIALRSLAATAGVVALAKAFQFGRAVFRATADFERIGKQLEFVTGSSYGAAKAMAFLRAEGERTGVNVRDLAPLYARLEFAMKQSGITAEETAKIFSGVTSAAATFALGQDDINRIFVAFTQVASKGTVQAEELRGQIGERLPGAFGLFAEAIGVSTMELSKMLELGQVSARELVLMGDKMNEVFGADMANKTDTLTAAMGRLSNAWDTFLESAGNSVVFKSLIETAKGYIEFYTLQAEDSFGDTLRRMAEIEDEVRSEIPFLRSLNKYKSEASEDRIKALQEEYRMLGLIRKAEARIRGQSEEELNKESADTKLRVAKETAADIFDIYTKAEREISQSFESERERLGSVAQARVDKLFEAARKAREVLSQNPELKNTEEGNVLEKMMEDAEELASFIADQLVRDLKALNNVDVSGILDIYTKAKKEFDQSFETEQDRLARVAEEKIETLAEAARKAREMLLETPGLENTEEGSALRNMIGDVEILSSLITDQLVRDLEALNNVDVGTIPEELLRGFREVNTEVERTERLINNALSDLASSSKSNALVGALFSGDVESMQARMDSMIEEHQMQMELIKTQKQQENETRLAYETRILEDITKERKRHHEEINKIDAVKHREQKDAFSRFSSDLLTLAESGSKKAAKAYKAIAIAETIISTIQGAQQSFTALAKIHPALGAAAAAVAMSAGMARVRMIENTQIGGRAHGGQISAGTSAVVGEYGPEIIRGPAQVTSIQTTKDRYSHRTTQKAPKVSVIVNNNSGAVATVRETTSGDDKTYEVLIERIERDISGRIATGGNNISRSLENAYTLRRGLR